MPHHVATKADGDEGGAAAGASLAELVAARISHDLASPLGAIGNGVELMREAGAGDEEDLELIASSAARTAGLLSLHRLAFGPQPADAEPMARAELARRLAPVFAGERVTLTVEGVDGPGLPAPAARLAALMALAGRALAGRSAEVVLRLGPEAALPLELAVRGYGLAWPAALEALVGRRGAPATPREVEFALLPDAARAAGARLAVTQASGGPGLLAAAA